jgi:hypothetical protein
MGATCRVAEQKTRRPRKRLSSEAFRWLRGSDLNRRPLGYEGNSGPQSNRDEPMGTNEGGDLQDCQFVPCCRVLVALLHSRFIAKVGFPPSLEPLRKSHFERTASDSTSYNRTAFSTDTASRSERGHPRSGFLDERSRAHHAHPLT